MQKQNRSEVARLKAELELRTAAANAGLYGTSLGNAQHKVITKRMERMGETHEELIGLMGEARASQFAAKTMNRYSG